MAREEADHARVIYKMPLEKRRRVADRRRERYQLDPAYRLARINAARAIRGSQEIQSLEQAGMRAPIELRARDSLGRFT